MCHCVSFWVVWEIVFGVTYVIRVQYKIECRNRYLEEGMDDGQMTPHEYPTFNSYVQNLHALHSRWTDRQMTPHGYPTFNSYIYKLCFSIGRTEISIRGGLGNLIGSSRYTHSAWADGGTFSLLS